MANFDDVLSALEKQRAELEAQFQAVRSQALEECLKMVKQFSFTAEELKIQPVCKDKVEKPVRKLPPKYKNPVGEETWTGRGAHKPKWFVDALAAGYTEDQMRISNP